VHEPAAREHQIQASLSESDAALQRCRAPLHAAQSHKTENAAGEHEFRASLSEFVAALQCRRALEHAVQARVTDKASRVQEFPSSMHKFCSPLMKSCPTLQRGLLPCMCRLHR